jgi:multidrug efflux pump subunit AcrA (membrane-fusion protein)
VTAAADGTVTDAAPDSGTIVAAGDRLFTIDPSGGKLHANVAVPVDRRSELFEGEQVQVRLGGVGDSELGYVHGEVEQVDPYPAGDDELRRVFGGQRLVNELAGDTAVYLVRVRLLEDPSTKSGLDWSSRTGASASVSAGELVDADFIVSESSLVEQVFP